MRDLYGEIPNDFFIFTPPVLPELSSGVLIDVFYYVLAIVFVSGVASLLCSSMADRLADNRGAPFNPDKEFWGQGLVQVITPMVNGFPCTGALARTATSIKAGAVTPLGLFQGYPETDAGLFHRGLSRDGPDGLHRRNLALGGVEHDQNLRDQGGGYPTIDSMPA